MADTNERERLVKIRRYYELHGELPNEMDSIWLIMQAEKLLEPSDPPADSALADLIAHMDHGAKLVDAIGALCCDGSPERNAADAIRKAAAALRARAVPEGKKYHDVAQRLYALLDDIDTAGDIAKSDDKLYRGIVERTQAKKRDFVVSCDGYTVTLADDSMLAASKEAP